MERKCLIIGSADVEAELDSPMYNLTGIISEITGILNFKYRNTKFVNDSQYLEMLNYFNCIRKLLSEHRMDLFITDELVAEIQDTIYIQQKSNSKLKKLKTKPKVTKDKCLIKIIFG